jgi:sulfoxide reductase catalytic subunit YedY
MVIPWIGYSLKKLLELAQPLGSAKFVEFTTLADPNQMPAVGGFNPVLNWPYLEALRIDEAYHPLTLMTFGLYGHNLPEQNGAPVRVIVPWKYGFKSAKSIVRIKFVENMPLTSWVESAPGEYGFFSNVNPNVPHRRWSQKTERRIGEGGIFSKRHKTLMFNGYANEVSNMYTGMDLKKFF